MAVQGEKKKKWEPPPPPPRVGRKQRRRDAAGLGSKMPTITPSAKCKLRLLKLERVKVRLKAVTIIDGIARVRGCCYSHSPAANA